MQDQIGIPSCFSFSETPTTDDEVAITRPGQSVFMSTYQTKIADQYRFVTVTWCKNLLLHGLSVSLQGPEGEEESLQRTCKIELKPWYFWRKQGAKRIVLLDDAKPVDIFWDLKAAKFNGETEPISEYYVAVVYDKEVILLIGDLRKDAYRKTGCRPALADPVLVSRKEHIFGKRRFATKVKFHEKGRFHDISIECKNRMNANSIDGSSEPEMDIRIDGHLVIHVKHLQWKFRGNDSIQVSKARVEVYWDVHDWLFSPGLRHALFIFKPFLTAKSSPSSSSSPPLTLMSSRTGSSESVALEGYNASGSSEFCLFLYAWKVE